jgi:16S rRNA processing protein RimM
MGDAPALIIIGRVRKAHGIRGEVLVEPITDAPDEVFSSGRRVVVGTINGDVPPNAPTLTITNVREQMGSLRLTFAEIPDRTAAELWRGRYLLLPHAEIPAPGDDEIYVHDLVGLALIVRDGPPVGTVTGSFDLPQGLMLDVTPTGGGATFLVNWHEPWIVEINLREKRLVMDLPEGLVP